MTGLVVVSSLREKSSKSLPAFVVMAFQYVLLHRIEDLRGLVLRETYAKAALREWAFTKIFHGIQFPGVHDTRSLVGNI